MTLDGEVVRVELTNTRSRDSREVVQVYLQPADADEPIRLVGWTTVDLPAGHTRAIEVTCDHRAGRTWTGDGWRPISRGRLLVARGLGDIRGEVALPG